MINANINSAQAVWENPIMLIGARTLAEYVMHIVIDRHRSVEIVSVAVIRERSRHDIGSKGPPVI